MRWADLLVLLLAASYQMVAFPFAALFHHLCASGHLSLTARYILFLTGGCLLAGTAKGSYTVLLLIPAAGSMLILLSISPVCVHTWLFALQMSWQTLCHLAVSLPYGSSHIPVRGRCCGDVGQHIPHVWACASACNVPLEGSSSQVLSTSRPTVALSAITLLTQKAMSLALDRHQGLVPLQLGQGLQKLPLCSYLLFSPALLGGPLCSFSRFQAQAESCGALPRLLRATGQQCLCALALQNLCTGLAAKQGCTGPGCLPHIWAWALLFRLAYYWHWVLDEALLELVGFRPEAGQGDLSLLTLETTHCLAVFTTWNKSTSHWLRRLLFQRCLAEPFLATFAFSAWWHGLRPRQIFSFLCWAVMVEANYLIHPFRSTWATSKGVKLLYCGTTWIFRQLIITYVLVAVETESFSTFCLLWTSCNSIFPISYSFPLLLLLAKKPKQN
ncbi:LOW QUALITY PROTEIN: ghrelin O-acyltransferase [Chlamydotis macqueenii]